MAGEFGALLAGAGGAGEGAQVQALEFVADVAPGVGVSYLVIRISSKASQQSRTWRGCGLCGGDRRGAGPAWSSGRASRPSPNAMKGDGHAEASATPRWSSGEGTRSQTQPRSAFSRLSRRSKPSQCGPRRSFRQRVRSRSVMDMDDSGSDAPKLATRERERSGSSKRSRRLFEPALGRECRLMG